MELGMERKVLGKNFTITFAGKISCDSIAIQCIWAHLPKKSLLLRRYTEETAGTFTKIGRRNKALLY